MPFPGDSAPESGARRHAPPILWIFAVRKDAPSSVTACADTFPQWEGVRIT